MKKRTGNIDKIEYGSFGESEAVKFLEDKDYEVIEQNFRCRMGEIDIVAKDKDDLVFIEVKTRSNKVYGFPREAVNFRKQQTIGRCALLFLTVKKKYQGRNYRFDVIEIITNSGRIECINHFENAYQPRVWST